MSATMPEGAAGFEFQRADFPVRLENVRTLLERAIYDLDHGWPSAARDAVGRALELLPSATKSATAPRPNASRVTHLENDYRKNNDLRKIPQNASTASAAEPVSPSREVTP